MLEQFPFLKQNLIYFDSAATSLKPLNVIEAQSRYYSELGINTGRGTSLFNYKTTDIIESVRERISNFIGSGNPSELVFTTNSTDSINMVAQGYVKKNIKENSNIVITQLEHHSNYVPWVNLAEELNIECRIIPLDRYKIDYSFIDRYIDENTIITAVTGMSNLTGDKTNLKPFIDRCRKTGSKILIDAAQLVVHEKLDVKTLDVDFLVFSAHKLYGPFGLGFLYGKTELLEEITPVRFGGNMVSYITDNINIHYRDIPRRLESGTGNSAAVYAFNSVLDFLEKNPLKEAEKYIQELSEYLICALKKIKGITIYSSKGSIISFNIDGIHPHDASEFFDNKNIILRTGNLCASPFFTNIKESGVIRVSLGIFNTNTEIDKLIETIIEIKEFFL